MAGHYKGYITEPEGIRKISDSLAPIIGLLIKISGGVGGTVLVVYALKEHFFYDVTSISAVGTLLIVALMFIAIILIGTIYGAICSIWIFKVMLWILNRLRIRQFGLLRFVAPFNGWVSTTYSLVIFVVILTTIAKLPKVPNWEVLLYFVLSGFIVCVLATERVRESRIERNPPWIAIIPVVLLPLYSNAASYFLNKEMVALSFRSAPGDFVILREQAYQKVSALGKFSGIAISSCELGKDLWLLKGVVLDWHGVGTISYLRLEGKPDASVLIPLASNDVQSIRVSPEIAGDCPPPKPE